MKNKKSSLLAIVLLYSSVMVAQVQVSKEPRHKMVLENKYVRLLDVNIPPGDTSLFHIHSTPSVFLIFTNTTVGAQVKGKDWEIGKDSAGYTWYRSFINDTLVHRVSNCDTVPFHVTDVELLTPYKPGSKPQPLPFPLLFENEKVFAYRLAAGAFNKQMISGRGPMIAQLVKGSEVTLHNKKGKAISHVETGKYVYIKPAATFYFSAAEDTAINMVLFEIK